MSVSFKDAERKMDEAREEVRRSLRQAIEEAGQRQHEADLARLAMVEIAEGAIALGFSESQAAQALGMPVKTYRNQRRWKPGKNSWSRFRPGASNES